MSDSASRNLSNTIAECLRHGRGAGIPDAAVVADGLVKLSFARSGGLVAAPGLQIRASATLEVSGGLVVADPDYQRVLDPQESAAVMSAAETLARSVPRVLDAAHVAVSEPTARDAFRFQFTIETSSGDRADLLTSEPDSRSGPAELGSLVRWAAREADAIVRRRLGPTT